MRKKLNELSNLYLLKEKNNKRIALIQNALKINSQEINIKTKDQILSEYFDAIIDFVKLVVKNNNEFQEILKDIQDAKNNIEFNEINKSKFTKEELNTKYKNRILAFNADIWNKVENLCDKLDFPKIDIFFRKNIAKLKSEIDILKDNQKKNELLKSGLESLIKDLSKLQEKNDNLVKEIKNLDNEISLNLCAKKSNQILYTIFSGFKMIENEYMKLNEETKNDFKISYRKDLYNHCNKIENIDFIKFKNKIKNIINSQNINDDIKEFKKQIEDVLNYFFIPKKFIKIKASVECSNSQFRDQMIFILEEIALFYKVKDYIDFESKFNFIENDQINPYFNAYKLNNIFSSKKNINFENDQDFKKAEENKRIWEFYKFLDVKIDKDIFNKISSGKLGKSKFMALSKYLDLEKIQILLKFKNPILLIDNLYHFSDKELFEKFFSLDKTKLEILSKSRSFHLIIKILNEKELVEKFFQLQSFELEDLLNLKRSLFNNCNNE